MAGQLGSHILDEVCDLIKALDLLYSCADQPHCSRAIGAYSFAIFSGFLETRAARS